MDTEYCKVKCLRKLTHQYNSKRKSKNINH